MSNILGSLFVELKANTAAFVEGMSKAGYSAQQAGKQIESSLGNLGDVASRALGAFGPMSEQFAAFGSILGGVSTGIGGVAAGLIAFTGAAAESSARTYELSESAGVSVETLSELSFVAQSAGVSQDTLALALARMSKNAVLATEGSKQQKEAFDALGVTVINSDGTMRDAESIFHDVAKGLAGMTDETERTAIEQEIFGRSGAQLAGMFTLMAEKGDQLIAVQRQLGAVLTKEVAEGAEKFKVSANEAGLAFDAWKLQIESGLQGPLTHLTNWFVDILKLQKQWNDNAMKAAEASGEMGMAIYHGTPPVPPAALLAASRSGDVAETANPESLLAANAAMTKRLAENAKYSADAVLSKEQGEIVIAQMNELAKATLAENAAVVQQDADLSKLKLDMSGYKDEMTLAQKVIEESTPGLAKYGEQVEKVNKLVADGLVTQQAASTYLHDYGVEVGAIADQTGKQVEKMSSSWKSFGDALSSDLGRLVEGGKHLAKIFDDMLKQFTELALKAALVGPAKGTSVGGLTGALGGLFRGGRAGGGSVDPGAMYMVGESGPELFSPQTPGTIVPNGGFAGHSVTYNVDARNAAPGVGPEIVSALKEAEDRAVFRSINALRQLNIRTAGGVFGS